MGETSAERKARIAALRSESQGGGAGSDDLSSKRKRTEGDVVPEPVIKFRNYAPTDVGLKENILEKTQTPSIETEVNKTLKAIRHEELEEKGDEMDLLNLAPRKIDWDLKRDLAKKLEKLERRTNRSVVEILQAKHAAANDPDA